MQQNFTQNNMTKLEYFKNRFVLVIPNSSHNSIIIQQATPKNVWHDKGAILLTLGDAWLIGVVSVSIQVKNCMHEELPYPMNCVCACVHVGLVILEWLEPSEPTHQLNTYRLPSSNSCMQALELVYLITHTNIYCMGKITVWSGASPEIL